MRRPCADCEEKRVTYGDDEPDDDADQEQLDLDNPNQRGLLVAEKFLLPSPDQDVDARVGALAKAPMKERSDVRSGCRLALGPASEENMELPGRPGCCWTAAAPETCYPVLAVKSLAQQGWESEHG